MLLLFLTLISLVLVLTACVTGQWVLLGIIPILFLGWVIWKFALWAAGQVPTWQAQIQNWWATVVVPWWATNTSRVLRALMVLAIIATAIAIVICVTVKYGPSFSSSGSICPACKGAPTAIMPAASAPDSLTHVFNVNSSGSETWVLPRNPGYVLTWNADNLTVPYEIITDHGNFTYHPGSKEVEIGITRSLAFRTLTDTTTKIRAVLRKS